MSVFTDHPDKNTDGTLVVKRRSPLPFVLLFLAALISGIFLGRTFFGPGRAAPAVVDAEKEGGATGEGSGEVEPAESGVVKFDGESLRMAGLRIEPVRYRPLQAQLAVTGTVEPNLGGVVKVTPRVEGKVTSVLANVGDSVRAGQALAELTSTQLGEAQSRYRQAAARSANARTNLVRQRRLAGLGAFGQPQVQEARRAFTAATGEANQARAEVNAARAEIVQARAALAAARSAEESARSDVGVTRAAVAQARTQVEVSQSRFNRQGAMLKEELTSRQEWEGSRADSQKSQADLQAANAQVSSSEAKVSAARAQGRQAAAEIETNRARLEQANARLAAAREGLDIARQALAREESVYKQGIYTSREVAAAENELRQAELEVRGAADAVRLLGGSPGGGNLLAVTSPLAGRVTERLVTVGETVTPEKALFTVLNLKSVWVQLNVYPKDLPLVRVGQSVAVTSEAAPGRTFTGTLSYISDVVDETTRTAKARAVIQNAPGLLKPQTFVRGTVATGRTAGALAVPKDAVQNLDGKTVVFVAGDHPNEFKAKEVQTGGTAGGLTKISSGLGAGERVVTQGAFVVKAQAMKGELSEE